jgi:hypothetical protein
MIRTSLLILAFSFAFIADSGIGLSQTSQPSRSTKIGPDELKNFVHKQLGAKVNAAAGTMSEPTYLIGDFNGDGNSDIAIMVIVEEGRDELKSNGVSYVNADPYSRKNGLELDPTAADAMGRNCLGVAFIHGTASGWKDPAAKYLIYDCFSAFKLFPKGRVIRRGSGSTGPTPKLKGDAMVLDLESGANALIYWNGKTYRGFGIRGGD